MMEVSLRPGWLKRDIARAVERIKEWSAPCLKCGGPTEHVCSWVCVDICPKCDRPNS